ncbi:TRAP transporter substrate-binding protein DctP [Pseudonocardia hispaniensis]|uniref:TRAP transporter substrate-binding protein DctP n=1 Tax=Pseudonocardia hispaniensis TaxID=904933 RepID=A0ABW1IXE1_9PSEU
MKRRLLSLAIAASVLVLAGCSGGGPAASDGGGDTITLKAASPAAGPEHFNSTPLIAYLDAVKKASGGRIDYEIYYGGALVPAAEIGNALGDGTVDLGMILASYKPDDYQVSNWLSQAAFVGHTEAPGSVLEKSAADLEWWWTNDDARKADWTDNGIVPMLPGVTPSAAYQMLCREPVTNLAEARGRTVKTSGTAEVATAKAMGMASTSIPAAETFEALQRGVVDCVFNNPGGMAHNGFWDAAKHFTTVNLPPFITWGLFFSEATWDRLSPEDRAILWENLPAYLEKEMANAIDIETTFYQGAPAKGVTLHDADEGLRSAIRDQQRGVLQDLPARAPSVLTDPSAALQDYLGLHDKWNGMLKTDLGIASDDSWAQWASQQNVPAVPVAEFARKLYDEVLASRMPERP